MIFYEEHKPDFIVLEKEGHFSYISHIHKQIELCYCESGSMEVTCDRKNYLLKEGSWMIAMPEVEHTYVSSLNLKAVLLIINPILIQSLSSYMKKKLNTPVIHNAGSKLEKYYHDLLEENEKNCSRAVLKGFLYIILGMLFEQCEFEEFPENYDTDLCHKVLKYISGNFKSDISLESIANHFGVNASYLSRAMHQKIGYGICDILYGYRVDYAKYLLSNSSMPITHVCFESGFSTQRNFNRWFYKLEKCTPNEYRNPSVDN